MLIHADAAERKLQLKSYSTVLVPVNAMMCDVMGSCSAARGMLLVGSDTGLRYVEKNKCPYQH